MNNAKFEIKNGQLVFKSTGEAIPEGVPVFVLLGIDTTALSTLRVYQSSMRPVTDNWKGLQNVIDDFAAFREAYPGEMKPPAEAYSSRQKGDN